MNTWISRYVRNEYLIFMEIITILIEKIKKNPYIKFLLHLKREIEITKWMSFSMQFKQKIKAKIKTTHINYAYKYPNQLNLELYIGFN